MMSNPGMKPALLHASFLLGLLLKTEDGGDMVLQNVTWLSPDYTASYLRRQKDSSRYTIIGSAKCEQHSWGTCNTTEIEQAGLAVTLYICRREVLSSNLGPEHRLSSKRFNDGFSRSLQANADYTATVSFQILYSSSLISHPTSRRSTVCTLQAALNITHKVKKREGVYMYIDLRGRQHTNTCDLRQAPTSSFHIVSG
jgi:hypothetical protein